MNGSLAPVETHCVTSCGCCFLNHFSSSEEEYRVEVPLPDTIHHCCQMFLPSQCVVTAAVYEVADGLTQ